MANITTGHDTASATQVVTAAPTKRVAKKQTPIWVIALAAPLSLVLFAGGARLVTELQSGAANMGGSVMIYGR